jgi:cyclic pyranopterin phosphate synthase
MPLCHPLPITRVAVDFNSTPPERSALHRPGGNRGPHRGGDGSADRRAGGLLTVYDMCKAADRGMVMTDIRVLEKLGGKSGDWVAAGV